MGTNKEISQFTRAQVVTLFEAGKSLREIASVVGNISISAVGKIIAKWKLTGSTKVSSRSGRPTLLNARVLRSLKRIVRTNRRDSTCVLTSKLAESIPRPVSSRSVRRGLKQIGYSSCTATHKPFISKKNQIGRVNFAEDVLKWDLEKMFQVIWSDESRFTLFQDDGRVHVWRLPSEKYNPECLVPKVQGNAGSVLVWAAFFGHSLGPCTIVKGNVNSDVYTNNILTEHLLPFWLEFKSQYPDLLFQQDNAPAHTSKLTKAWFVENAIETLPWPPQSPDLNPIENIWDHLEHQIRSRKDLPRTLNELGQALLEEWRNIPTSRIRTLNDGMFRRMKAVVKSKGMPTKY